MKTLAKILAILFLSITLTLPVSAATATSGGCVILMDQYTEKEFIYIPDLPSGLQCYAYAETPQGLDAISPVEYIYYPNMTLIPVPEVAYNFIYVRYRNNPTESAGQKTYQINLGKEPISDTASVYISDSGYDEGLLVFENEDFSSIPYEGYAFAPQPYGQTQLDAGMANDFYEGYTFEEFPGYPEHEFPLPRLGTSGLSAIDPVDPFWYELNRANDILWWPNHSNFKGDIPEGYVPAAVKQARRFVFHNPPPTVQAEYDFSSDTLKLIGGPSLFFQHQTKEQWDTYESGGKDSASGLWSTSSVYSTPIRPIDAIREDDKEFAYMLVWDTKSDRYSAATPARLKVDVTNFPSFTPLYSKSNNTLTLTR
jgi:hypothetical protein